MLSATPPIISGTWDIPKPPLPIIGLSEIKLSADGHNTNKRKPKELALLDKEFNVSAIRKIERKSAKKN